MKKVKLPLEMANGQQVRSLQELRDNWDLEKVLGYYLNGRLLTWLNDRYYVEEAEKIQQLEEFKNSKDLLPRLCAVFEVQYKDSDLINVQAIEKRNQKLERLRLYTADDVILKNVDKVAFDQAELEHLTAHGGNIIYLCSGEFNIEKSLENMIYIGIDNPIVKMDRETWQQLRKKNCVFNNCNLNIDKGDILSVEKKKSFLLKHKENSWYLDSKIFVYGNFLIVLSNPGVVGSELYIYDLNTAQIVCTGEEIQPSKKRQECSMFLDNLCQYQNYLILHWESNVYENCCFQTIDLNKLKSIVMKYYCNVDGYPSSTQSIKYMHINNEKLFVDCNRTWLGTIQSGKVYSLPELEETSEFVLDFEDEGATRWCGRENCDTNCYEHITWFNGCAYAFLSKVEKIISNDPEHREVILSDNGETGRIGFFKIINNNIFVGPAINGYAVTNGIVSGEYGFVVNSLIKADEIGIFDINGGEPKKLIKDPTFINEGKYCSIHVWKDIKYAAGMYWINSVDQKFYALDEDTFEVLREFDAGVTDNASYICDVTVDEEGNRIFVLRANGVIDIFK